MSVVKIEDIMGVRVSGRIICKKCYTDDLGAVKVLDMITRDEIEGNNILYCDECKQPL